MKLGMIGLDSSHAVEFARILNGGNEPFHIGGHPVTAACAGEMANDFDMSYQRMDKITRAVTKEWGVKLYPDIPSVMEQADAVFLEQVDARIRVRQFEEIVSFGKPVFVDKPFALSTAECCRMLELADRYGAPVLSASALRFADGLTEALRQCKDHPIHGADFFGPMPFVKTQPGYFWYGVHMADMLYRTMGTGCSRVRAIHTERYDLITGIWKDGRLGTIRGNRVGNGNFGGTVFFGTHSGAVDVSKDSRGYYESLLEAIIAMFDSGTSPVSGDEMTEIVRFLEASNESWQTGREILL
ncbi:MAG: Gfo/Idh/MocA family oxidoreductase [Lachnospiraceae bacterium]|nr:Gfo/Idh/MocA family oxidoreductase [Lachnospiraceae bacterium]